MERVVRWVVVAVAAALAATVVSAVGAAPAAVAVTDPCIGAPRAPFVDVGDDHTHAAGIDCLAGLRVIQGRDVDAFDPSASLRRDQMATIVAGTIEAATGRALPAGSRGAFDDLAGNVHRDAIEALARAGIVEGRAPGRYDPNQRVPRGQMTAFLVRAHDHLLGASDEPAPDAFRDDTGTPTRRRSTARRSSAWPTVAPRRSSVRRNPPAATRPRRSPPGCWRPPLTVASWTRRRGGTPAAARCSPTACAAR